LKILDLYIIRKFVGTFFFCLLVLTIIAIVIDVTEKVDSFIDKKAPLKEIVNYYLVFIPHITALLFPLFVFVAVIFFTSRLASKSEVIAMLNGGMSYNRFLVPYIAGGILFSLFILYANHTFIPKANKLRLKFENKYINFNSIKTGTDMHYRISPSEFVYLKSFNIPTKTGNIFSYEKIIDGELKEKIFANEIAYDSIKNTWKLKQVRKRTMNGSVETFVQLDTLQQKMNFKPSDVIEEYEIKQAMTTKQLQSFIDRERRKGNPALNTYEVEKHRRSAAPASVLILTIIGAIMSSKKVRGGSGIHLAIGLLIGAAYIVFMQFSTTFSIKGSLHPMLAVWIPNFIFAGLALIIYKKYNT
jgi:lipopolysaccharide export system permease protein